MTRNLADHETYRRPPFSPDRIRAGVDRCVAALAEAKARRQGVDPYDAMDAAEAEAGSRRLIRSKRCRHCRATPDRPCVNPATGLEMGGYHSCRVEDAMGGAA